MLRDEEMSSKTGASISFQSWVERNDLIDLGYVEASILGDNGLM